MQFRFLTVLAFIASGAIFSWSAYAAERSLVIEEIIVTARKTEESVQDVPIAITALSSEQLQSSTIRTLSDLTGYIPNATINEDG